MTFDVETQEGVFEMAEGQNSLTKGVGQQALDEFVANCPKNSNCSDQAWASQLCQCCMDKAELCPKTGKPHDYQLMESRSWLCNPYSRHRRRLCTDCGKMEPDPPPVVELD